MAFGRSILVEIVRHCFCVHLRELLIIYLSYLLGFLWFRVYREGAILNPHVDRNPLVSSAIINVAQDPDMTEDWPLEVYGTCRRN